MATTVTSFLKAQNVTIPTTSTYKLIAPAPLSSITTLTGSNLVFTTGKQNIGIASNVANESSNQSVKSLGVVSLNSNDAADSIRGDSLQQLSTNALPPYAPPTSSNSVSQNSTGTQEIHCCTDCGDTFAVKSSLSFHLERRSVLIKFICESCTSPQIYYNRCALLSHVRSHADKKEPSNMHKAIVSPLPRVFMDGINSDFVNNLEEELNFVGDLNDTTPANLLEFSLKEVDSFDENKDAKKEADLPEPSAPSPDFVVDREILEISPVKVKCFDCDQEFESVSARKEHLTNGDKIPAITDKDVTLCTKCGILCPSKCSFKAHQRTHLQVSPYICPECGESPNPYWDQFQAHLRYKCFHFSRAIGLKCPVCKRVVRNSEALQKHMELHTERYAKCDNCPRAFKSPAAFNAHKKSDHDGAAVLYHIIYKCALCDIVFLTKERMLKHKDEHLKDQVREYIFNCMQCGKALDCKLTLLEHLKACHMKTYRMNVCEEVKKSKTNNMEYRGRVECMICHCSFLSHQGYGVHIARSHINSKIPCSYCYCAIAHRKEMITHGKKHLLKGDLVCLLCHNKRFENKNPLISHLYTHIDKLKYCTFCPICDEELSTPMKALQHLRIEHFLEATPTDPKKVVAVKSVPTEKSGVACHFCRITLEDETSLERHLANEHSVGVKRPAENGTVLEEPLPKRQRPAEDTCAKCNFKSSNRTEFKKHILTHKVNKSTFQCQDCGLCFVVQPSLTKHLRIVHKVYDVKKYIDEEGTNFTPDKTTAVSSTHVYALMCSVCSITFLTESALRTHMRSHGMAFIQAKKSIVS